jgi:hypothetical protein
VGDGPLSTGSQGRMLADLSVPICKLNLKRLAVVHAPVNDLKA